MALSKSLSLSYSYGFTAETKESILNDIKVPPYVIPKAGDPLSNALRDKRCEINTVVLGRELARPTAVCETDPSLYQDEPEPAPKSPQQTVEWQASNPKITSQIRRNQQSARMYVDPTQMSPSELIQSLHTRRIVDDYLDRGIDGRSPAALAQKNHSRNWREHSWERTVTSLTHCYVDGRAELQTPPFKMVVSTGNAPNLWTSPKDLQEFVNSKKELKDKDAYTNRMKLIFTRLLWEQMQHKVGVSIVPLIGGGLYLNELTPKAKQEAIRCIYTGLKNALEELKAILPTSSLKEIILALPDEEKNSPHPAHDSIHALFKDHAGPPLVTCSRVDVFEAAKVVSDKRLLPGIINPGSDRTIGGSFFRGIDATTLEEQIGNSGDMVLCHSVDYNPDLIDEKNCVFYPPEMITPAKLSDAQKKQDREIYALLEKIAPKTDLTNGSIRFFDDEKTEKAFHEKYGNTDQIYKSIARVECALEKRPEQKETFPLLRKLHTAWFPALRYQQLKLLQHHTNALLGETKDAAVISVLDEKLKNITADVFRLEMRHQLLRIVNNRNILQTGMQTEIKNDFKKSKLDISSGLTILEIQTLFKHYLASSRKFFSNRHETVLAKFVTDLCEKAGEKKSSVESVVNDCIEKFNKIPIEENRVPAARGHARQYIEWIFKRALESKLNVTAAPLTESAQKTQMKIASEQKKNPRLALKMEQPQPLKEQDNSNGQKNLKSEPTTSSTLMTHPAPLALFSATVDRTAILEKKREALREDILLKRNEIAHFFRENHLQNTAFQNRWMMYLQHDEQKMETHFKLTWENYTSHNLPSTAVQNAGSVLFTKHNELIDSYKELLPKQQHDNKSAPIYTSASSSSSQGEQTEPAAHRPRTYTYTDYISNARDDDPILRSPDLNQALADNLRNFKLGVSGAGR
jgi:hypothetical protein